MISTSPKLILISSHPCRLSNKLWANLLRSATPNRIPRSVAQYLPLSDARYDGVDHLPEVKQNRLRCKIGEVKK